MEKIDFTHENERSLFFFVLRSAKNIKNDAYCNYSGENEKKVGNRGKPRVYKGCEHVKIHKKRGWGVAQSRPCATPHFC
jgi:hypothetical protein